MLQVMFQECPVSSFSPHYINIKTHTYVYSINMRRRYNKYLLISTKIFCVDIYFGAYNFNGGNDGRNDTGRASVTVPGEPVVEAFG